MIQPSATTDERPTNDEQPQVLDPDNLFHHTDDPLYREQPRLIIPRFIDRSEKLGGLRDDPRVVAIVSGLIGEDYDYAESDGNLFNCDVYWHMDAFGAPISVYHINLLFYLDSLSGASGALRVIPGSNVLDGSFVGKLRENLVFEPSRVKDAYGIALDEIPSWTVEVEPGDREQFPYAPRQLQGRGGSASLHGQLLKRRKPLTEAP